MDRDFVLEWQPTAASEPRAIAFTETVANRSYVLAMFLPPDEAALAQTQPREMLLVIDTSGSMGGPSIEQAKRALQFALGRLNAGDRFNVIEFNSATRALFPGPVAAEPRTLAAASRFVAGLNADGGTEMEPAIRLALLQPTAPGYLRQIVFATDGSVGNEAALFEAIRRELGEARLFTIGIGAAPNSHFMRKAAQYGRGTFTQIGKLDELEPRMQALFEKLEHAALTGIEIEWPAVAEVFPERVPDLYAGEPVVVAARFDRPVAGTRATPVRLGLEAHGTIGRLRWDQHVDVEPAGAEGVATSWARRKIEALLDSRLEGAEEDAIREAVVDVGLAFNLVSPYTSLVAVDKTPERTRDAALRRTAVANLLPAGVDAGAIFGSFPQTATDARVHLLAGFLLLAAALLVRARLGRAPR
jgi:Ca-activated chloride channel family protein